MSLGGSLGIDITSNSQQAETALDRTGKKLDQITEKAKRATLATRDMNKEMSQQLRTGALAARSTAAGSGLAAAAGGVQAGGIMGGIAVAAAATAVVAQVVKRFSDLAEESAHRRLNIENQLADAAEKAQAARGSSAERGLSQEEEYRKAFAFGGQDAINFAKLLESRGIKPTAAWGAASQMHPAETPEETEKRARILVRIGNRGEDVVAAAKNIEDRPWLTSMDEQGWKAGGHRRSHEVSLAANNVTGKNVDPLFDWQMGRDKFLDETIKNRLIKGQVSAADRSNAANGYAAEAAGRELRMARSPETELRNDALRSLDKQEANLERLAQMQASVFKLMDDVFSPGGSFETQLIRAMKDRNRVLSGDP